MGIFVSKPQYLLVTGSSILLEIYQTYGRSRMSTSKQSTRGITATNRLDATVVA